MVILGRNHKLQVLNLPLDADHDAESIWLRVAEITSRWLDGQGLAIRDAVLLLPFAQALAPARRAWSRLGRWQPRIETTHSLAAAWGPNVLAQAGQISFDPAIDVLSADELLHGQSWAQALKRSDERAYRQGLSQLVELAHALSRAAGQRSPGERDAFWQNARGQLSQPGGLLGVERALALVALEWAVADARTPPTDALFDLTPSAWIVLQAGGPDPLAENLLAASSVPCLRLVADLDLDQALPLGSVEEARCQDFEDLAQCSAAAVLQHLAAGRTPVALIAQDRVLVRRVRALLERQGLPMQDETGWTLATTPAAAQLMALLRAASRRASLDEVLGWLKADLARDLRSRAGGGALAALESRCRQRGWRRPQQVRAADLAPAGARLWDAALATLAALHGGPARRSLEDWRIALGECLQSSGAEIALREQEAGEKVLDALWLTRSPWPESAHAHALQTSLLSAAEFVAWVDASLEAQQYVPPSGDAPQLIITPLARAMLRPFKAIVLPGADAQGLGLAGKLPALLSERQAHEIGLPDLQHQREALAHAFAQTLRAPALTLVRRVAVGAEPLAASPLVERLALALARAGRPSIANWADERPLRAIQPAPSMRAAAQTPGLLPASLSASSLESLRQCPYQFFGRVMLGLREQDELDTEVEKRDYGTWLHDVLKGFHDLRLQPDAVPDEPLLRQCAADAVARHGLPPEEFLPFMASFERLVPRYLAWLAEAEHAGQRYVDGEIEREIEPFSNAPLSGLRLQGRIDRVDEQGGAQVLIDYKTGSASGLKAKVAAPLEDTQLAVYAALMFDEDKPMKARYLALDDNKGLAEVEHPEVVESAAQLIEGLGEDLRALHGGTPLPALGDGPACEYCAVRGLCRRDDWSAA
jgi:ATP-dependent helicase/nuclease subunit B